MKRNIALIAGILMISMTVNAWGAKVEIKSNNVQVIVNPENKRDSRILLYFDISDITADKEVYIDFATFNISLKVEGGVNGSFEVYPVLTDWSARSEIDWVSTWNTPGGDYDDQKEPGRYSLKSEYDEKNVSIDVTDIVRDWAGGVIANNGIIVKLEDNDLLLNQVEYEVGVDEAFIEIFYTKRSQDKESGV